MTRTRKRKRKGSIVFEMRSETETNIPNLFFAVLNATRRKERKLEGVGCKFLKKATAEKGRLFFHREKKEGLEGFDAIGLNVAKKQ